MVERGVIENRERARQIIDFSGLRYGNITPTDIDGCIEYKNKAVILLEYKHRNTEMPYGQRLAFERIADDIVSAGKDCVFLLCSHDVDNCEVDIDGANAIVTNIYWHGKNSKPRNGITVGEQIEKYIAFIDGDFRQ